MTTPEEPTDDPLKWLSEKEADVVSSVLTILGASIQDKELREDLCGMILVSIDEWGKQKLLASKTDNPQ